MRIYTKIGGITETHTCDALPDELKACAIAELMARASRRSSVFGLMIAVQDALEDKGLFGWACLSGAVAPPEAILICEINIGDSEPLVPMWIVKDREILPEEAYL